MTAFFALAFFAAPAHASLIDDYASRHDWACAYGKTTVSCGGPDSWVDVAAAHTIVICGEGDAARICGETWRLSGEAAVIAPVIETWGKQLEGELSSTNWVLTPAQLADTWLAALRDNDTLAALEVGRDYVQVRVEERTPCIARTAGLALDPYVVPVLPEVEKEDPIALALALPWTEAKLLPVGAVSGELVARVLGREVKERYDKGMLQRWTFLASEPYQCILELRKQKDARAGLPIVFDEWRKATAPTPAERKLQKARDRELARLGKKNEGVETGEETLTDEVQPEEEPKKPSSTGLDNVDVDDLLGADDPAND